jgi:hypothetical protein
MNTCIVTVEDVEDGIYREWPRAQYPVRGVMTGQSFNYDAISDDDLERRVTMWACQEKDVDVVVNRMSNIWVNREIKVFNLSKISVRLPGELVNKRVTEDGVLPE